MKKHLNFFNLIIGLITLLALVCNTSVFAQSSENPFSDRSALLDTTISDAEQAVLEEASTNFDIATTDLAGATTGLATEQGDFDTATTDLAGATTDLATATTEIESAENSIEQLSDEQVIALNQSLNNAVKSDLGIDLDAEDLERVVEGDFNKQQIFPVRPFSLYGY